MKSILNNLAGAMIASFAAVVAFWVGSSNSSARKDEMLRTALGNGAGAGGEPMTLPSALRAWLPSGRPAAPAAPPVVSPGASGPAEPAPRPEIPVHAVGDPHPGGTLGSLAGALSRPDPLPRFEACVAEVLRHEGGLVDHPSDPGGITKYGISLRAAQGMGGLADTDGDGDIDAADIRRLTVPQAKVIFRTLYWNAVRGDDLPPGIDLAVFDWAVNAGPLRAARGLQRALYLPPRQVDGAIGPVTLAHARRASPAAVAAEISRLRLEHLRGLHTWPIFGLGWERRVRAVEAAARAAAAAA